MKKALLFIFIFSHCQAQTSGNVALQTATQTQSSSHYILNNQTFDLPIPDESVLTEPKIAWATNYFIPEFDDGTGDFAIRDLDGAELGPKLSLKSWCISALEGSVKINLENGDSKVYNYVGNSEAEPVDCSTILPMDVSKTKFIASKSKFGEGTASYILAPYRTLATDHAVFPPGTVLYIPSARGNKITIGDATIIHDGYFFVGDRGGAIKDNHIDVFTGVNQNASFFKWIGHKADSTFKVYIIKDQSIIDNLTHLHRKK